MLKWSVEAKEVWKKNVSLIWLVMNQPFYYHFWYLFVGIWKWKDAQNFLSASVHWELFHHFRSTPPIFQKTNPRMVHHHKDLGQISKDSKLQLRWWPSALSSWNLGSRRMVSSLVLVDWWLVIGKYIIWSECQWIRLMDKCSSIAGIKTGSKPSIISSALASIVLAVAYTVCTRLISLYCWTNIFALQRNSLAIALGTTIALSVVFAIRFLKTKKLVPAGILGLLSLGFSTFFSYLKWAGAA